LNFVRPVTPKVAGSSPVAPAISINELVRLGYFGYSFLADPVAAFARSAACACIINVAHSGDFYGAIAHGA
jgi:hypothetical protein